MRLSQKARKIILNELKLYLVVYQLDVKCAELGIDPALSNQ